ncbi:hypothetical protein ACTXT7_000613 [Hymenolepis weldensis]
MVLPVAANLCLRYLHLTLSSKRESRLKPIHRSGYDAGYAFQLDDKTIYIFLRISDPYLSKALLWTISDNEHKSIEPRNLFKDHKPDTLNVFQQLITIIQYFCDVFKAPFPKELAAFERPYYDFLVEVCNDLENRGELFGEIISGDFSDFSDLHTELFQFWFGSIAQEIVPFCKLLITPSATELEMRYREVAENEWLRAETRSAIQKVEIKNATYIENSSISTESFLSNGSEIRNAENIKMEPFGNGGEKTHLFPSNSSNDCEIRRKTSSPSDVRSIHGNFFSYGFEGHLFKNGIQKIFPKSSSLEVQIKSSSESESIVGNIPNNESKTPSSKSTLSSPGSEIMFEDDLEEREMSKYETPPSRLCNSEDKKWKDILKSEDSSSFSSFVSFHSNEIEKELFKNGTPLSSPDFDWNSSDESSRMKILTSDRTPSNSPPPYFIAEEFEVAQEVAYGKKSQMSFTDFSNPGVDKVVSNCKRSRQDTLTSTDSTESLTSPRKVRRLKAFQMKPLKEESQTWLKINSQGAATTESKMRKDSVQRTSSKRTKLDVKIDGILKHLVEGVQFFGQLDSVSMREGVVSRPTYPYLRYLAVTTSAYPFLVLVSYP